MCHQQLALYCKGHATSFSARVLTVDSTGTCEWWGGGGGGGGGEEVGIILISHLFLRVGGGEGMRGGGGKELTCFH